MMAFSRHLAELGTTRRCRRGFTLVELMVVMAIIVILLGASAALVPAMMRGNQMNEDVTTLQGLLEQARETALAGNTYVYVGFTAPTTDGTSAIIFESQDGQDVAAAFSNNITFPTTTDVQMVSRVQQLPGVQVVDVSDPAIVTTAAYTPPTGNGVALPLGGLSTSGTTILWQFTTNQTLKFIYGFEFTPNGEAKVPVETANPPITWYDEFQFALAPAVKGQNGHDVAVFRISRITGKATVYRP